MPDIKKIREESERLKREVEERTIGYITAALGLVAGLAWNDAIRSLIEYVLPAGTNSLLAKFAYAILITLVVVLITIELVRFIDRNGNSPK